MHYGKKHDLPFGIMDVAGLLRLNIRRRAPGQVYVDCPICGDRRGKMNLNTEKDLWRCNYCGEGGGMLSLYAKVYGVSNSDAYREICDALAVNGFSPDYTVPEKTTPAEAEQSDAASVQEVHQTLSMLLSMLTLIPAHREHLRSVRGLSDDEITRFGFKSTPPPFLCRSLTNRLVKAGCRVQGVPGFYVDDNGCWTVKFHQRTSGIIIPIFGVDGLIHGAQIRLDHPLKDKDDPPEKTGVKYLTLSSTGKRMGTTSGSPIHFVGDPCSRVVYVTEGCLKADVAHALMHRTFVATLGVNNTAKLDELFAFLHRNGTEEIIEAEDMDKYSNEMVEKGASKIYALAARHGMRCRRLTWNPNYKGIDDWQLALRRKEQKMKEDPGMTFKEQYADMKETMSSMVIDSADIVDMDAEHEAYMEAMLSGSIAEPAATSYSYDRERGRRYADLYYTESGRNTCFYNFDGKGGDCTNWVSQCVWAGYGGWTDGDSVATMKANIKARKRMQPSTNATNWYGHENGAGYNWSNVSGFWNLVTSNPTTGPNGTGYYDNRKMQNIFEGLE